MPAVDIERPDELRSYLVAQGHVDASEVLSIDVLAGGVSNRAVLVERPGGIRWVLKQALSKLRVEADWFSDPSRVHREALGLRWLRRLAPEGSIPGFVFEDFEHHILAMEAVPEPHRNWKTMLLMGDVHDEHVRAFGTLLGTVHRRGDEERERLELEFADRSFFENLRLEPYYEYSADRTPAAAPFLASLVRDTRSRGDTLVHGDYSPKNVLVRSAGLVLLDHEVIHFGDPGFDLGFSLTHLLSKAHHVAGRRESFQAAAHAYWRAYCEALGTAVTWSDGLEARAARHTLGCLIARVDGRSPLEYLTDRERASQRRVVLDLMHAPPQRLPDLIDAFVGGLP